MLSGVIEVLSRHFVAGWAADTAHGPAFLMAECRGRVLGIARADMARDDLKDPARPGHGYILVFDSPIAAEELVDVRVSAVGNPTPLRRIAGLRRDDAEACQIFVLGSPRSGTSEMGSTLTSQLKLPWLGETHAAPAFATAAKALAGDADSPNGLLRFMAVHHYEDWAYRAARQAYYCIHASASFLDKTPGVGMIRAVPFLRTCFPEARFIFMRRNGISNVLSRQAKFGGSFERHCQDWAAAMDAWTEVRDALPHFIEVEQERMLAEPEAVAEAVTAYVGRPDAAAAVTQSLTTGSRERTGAGIGRRTLAETGWSPVQVEQFRRFCGPTMERWGYGMG